MDGRPSSVATLPAELEAEARDFCEAFNDGLHELFTRHGVELVYVEQRLRLDFTVGGESPLERH